MMPILTIAKEGFKMITVIKMIRYQVDDTI